MQPKVKMTDAAQIVDHARFAAVELVRRQDRLTGSRMAAYGRVGAMVGASAGWVRKFIGRSHEVKPDLVVGWKLIVFYDHVCNRVEQAADNERSRAAALEAQIHEANSRNLELVRRMAAAQGAGAATPRKPGEGG